MAIEFFSSVDLNENQLQFPVIHPLNTAPTTGTEGQIYYDTGDNLIYVNTSTNANSPNWVSMGGDITGVSFTTDDSTTITDSSGDAAFTITGAGGLTTSSTGSTITLTIGTLNQNTTGSAGSVANALTVDDTTIQLNSGTTYDGSNARTISAKTAAIANGGAALATADQIHTFVTTQTDDIAANTTGSAATAATVTNAAQSNITSLGTLTTLTVDNVIINGTTIGHTSDTDLITLANGKVTITGDLDIIGSGTSTIIESSTVAIADSMLKLAKDQGTSADAVDFGFYGQYGVGGTAKYAGLFRDQSASGDPFVFFDGLQAEPGTTVNTSGTGYDLADIVAADGNFETLTIPDNAIAVGKIAAGTLPTDVKINNSHWSGTDLSIANGGTGQSTASAAFAALKQAATTSTTGVVLIASDADAKTGSNSGMISVSQLAARTVVADIVSTSVNQASNKSVKLTHNLGTTDLHITIYDPETEKTVYADVSRTTNGSTTSDNDIFISFGTNLTGNLRAIITAVPGGTSLSGGSIVYS